MAHSFLLLFWIDPTLFLIALFFADSSCPSGKGRVFGGPVFNFFLSPFFFFDTFPPKLETE